MKRIAIINGPNLNLLGSREPEVYGNQSLKELEAKWVAFGQAKGVEVTCFQSNVEGELINAIQAHGFDADAILINPGGYTHTSVAIRDAVAAVEAPVYEVHISHPEAREDFRKTSLIREVCAGSVSGLGVRGYMSVLDALLNVRL
ncbi:MAG: type II 3-dehydroquinate dehydratase [Flavobacteriales bacterium]|nr:type II 3-dehydroquinate dehydratase [Flavobacteriales bacterium]